MVQKVNVTLNNVSPLINYSPSEAWREGSSEDSYWQSYDHNGTFTLTTKFGASASVTFNGTAVWIYGARRDNHAPFNITLDSRMYYDDGYSSVNLFQQVLFPGPGLTGGNHTVTIMDSVVDATKPYLDIDSIIYEVDIPDGYERITHEDTDDAFWSFSSAWTTNPESLSSYSGGTGQYVFVEAQTSIPPQLELYLSTTSAQDGYVIYTFEIYEDSFSDSQTGSHVEIYGAVGPNNSAYTVQVDGGGSVVFNGTKDNLVPQTLLYQSNSLLPGSHTVNISNTPFVGQTLSIDYAVIYSSSSTGSGSSSSLSGGTIGGIVVGASAGLLLILFCVFLWHRRRSGRPGLTPTENLLATANHGTGPVAPHTPSFPTTVEQYQPLSVSASNANLLQPPSASTSTPSPPQSSSSASNFDTRPRLILHNPNPSSGGILGPVQESAPAPENSGPHQTPGYVTRPLPQPEQSNSRLRVNTSVLPLLPGSDLRSTRMQVEGRSQDFGPINFVPDPEHDGNLLPPDYYQATQPFPPRRR